ncbi:MAG: DUF559 domain-containing protein [Methanobacteriota archaeon]|nr:MAG: DUF559 domain-containing protein [Euryarchaeota archaeon]
MWRDARRAAIYGQLQYETASRPNSKRVPTPFGDIWMSPIEAQLYEAMRLAGLNPVPQFCVSGYFVDFAFPDVALAVEADGAAFHEGTRHERDRKRDWIIGRAGWTVKRFHGTTIYHRADNCAYVIRKEVDARWAWVQAQREWAEARAREEALRRQARREALLRPFKNFIQFLKRA